MNLIIFNLFAILILEVNIKVLFELEILTHEDLEYRRFYEI
jgi:hypothetical protein